MDVHGFAASASRDSRPSLRHDQSTDGRNPLPDEDPAGVASEMALIPASWVEDFGDGTVAQLLLRRPCSQTRRALFFKVNCALTVSSRSSITLKLNPTSKVSGDRTFRGAFGGNSP
jgi:hypothetical protein